mgnify:CR=1 FL=1
MKKLTKYLPVLVPVAAVLGSLMLPLGCANTTTPPTGGPKDTIPPVIRKISPLPGTVNVPVHKPKIVFTFNEYVTIKDANNVFLSPPLEKKPKAKISGKSVVVTFESDLDSNTTYTLDITGAIGDNNEGNLFPGYTLVFSTGPQIDSMCVTGLVQDCNTLMPMKGATVLLYKDHADSAVFLHRPDAAARTDDWGFFSIRNIQDTLYRVYAVKDENNNCIADTLPTVFKELIGAEISEYDPIGSGKRRIKDFAGNEFECGVWCDVLQATTARAYAEYDDGFYRCCPAVTMNRYCGGVAYYVGTVCGADFYESLAANLMTQTGIPKLKGLPRGVEVTTRTNGKEEYIFFFNNSKEHVTVGLPKAMYSLISSVGRDKLEIEPFGMEVVRK